MATLANNIATSLEKAIWECSNRPNFGDFSVPPTESWSSADTLYEYQSPQKPQRSLDQFPLTIFMEIVTPYRLQTLLAVNESFSANTFTTGICLSISLNCLEDIL